MIRLSPVVHSTLDTQGLTPALIGIARDKAVAAYVGDGANRWPAVHTLEPTHPGLVVDLDEGQSRAARGLSSD